MISSIKPQLLDFRGPWLVLPEWTLHICLHSPKDISYSQLWHSELTITMLTIPSNHDIWDTPEQWEKNHINYTITFKPMYWHAAYYHLYPFIDNYSTYLVILYLDQLYSLAVTSHFQKDFIIPTMILLLYTCNWIAAYKTSVVNFIQFLLCLPLASHSGQCLLYIL